MTICSRRVSARSSTVAAVRPSQLLPLASLRAAFDRALRFFLLTPSLTYTCDDCHDRKMAEFRPDVLTDLGYWTDEPIDDD